MEDLREKRQEQLNTSDLADYSVDDIIREFGSEEPKPKRPDMSENLDRSERQKIAEAVRHAEAEKRTKEALEQAGEDGEEVKIWTPKAQREEAPKEDLEKTIVMEPLADVPEEEPEEEPWQPEEEWEEPEEAEEEETGWIPRILWPRKKPQKEAAYETPEEAGEAYAFRAAGLRPAAVIAWIAMILSALAALVASNPQWGFDDVFTAPVCNAVTLGILLLHLILSFPVWWDALKKLARGEFTAKVPVLLAAVVTAVRGGITLMGDSLCLAPPASLLLTVMLWGDYLLTRARAGTVKTVLAMDDPTAVCRVENSWHDRACIHRTEADPSGIAGELEQMPKSLQVVNIFSAVLTALSVAVAVVLSVRGGRDFLWAWNILLLGICPLGGMLAYSRMFRLVSRRLQSAGAALSGWPGAGKLSGSVCAAVTDGDLFPPKNLSMNGIKIFGDWTSERVLGYASALLESSGAEGLDLLFRQTLEAQNGRRFHADNFRTYPTGGLGGEIGGQVVRLGSLGFMQSMGITVPEDAKKRHVLCLSVEGKVAAAFVLHYQPSELSRRGLAVLMGCRGLTTILASGDMQLTPNMVQTVYGLPAERLEYPSAWERAQLSSPRAPGEQGAFLARSAFLPFALAVSCARQLRRTVPRAAAVSLLGAVVGFFLMSYMALIGAYDTANAMNLLVYHAIWLLPVGLMTGIIGKS